MKYEALEALARADSVPPGPCACPDHLRPTTSPSDRARFGHQSDETTELDGWGGTGGPRARGPGLAAGASLRPAGRRGPRPGHEDPYILWAPNGGANPTRLRKEARDPVSQQQAAGQFTQRHIWLVSGRQSRRSTPADQLIHRQGAPLRVPRTAFPFSHAPWCSLSQLM